MLSSLIRIQATTWWRILQNVSTVFGMDYVPLTNLPSLKLHSKSVYGHLFRKLTPMYDHCATVLLIQYCYRTGVNSVRNVHDNLHNEIPQIHPIPRLPHLPDSFRMDTHLYRVRIPINTKILEIWMSVATTAALCIGWEKKSPAVRVRIIVLHPVADRVISIYSSFGTLQTFCETFLRQKIHEPKLSGKTYVATTMPLHLPPSIADRRTEVQEVTARIASKFMVLSTTLQDPSSL